VAAEVHILPPAQQCFCPHPTINAITQGDIRHGGLIKVATAAQGLAVIALAAAKESWGLLAAAVLVAEAAALGPVVANAQSHIGTRLVSWTCR
jgi:hypothetical protein